MRAPRLLLLVPGLAIAALTLSCKDKPAENTADATATMTPVASSVAPLASTPPVTSASGGAEGEGRHGGGGPGQWGLGGMLFQATKTLDLKDDQKTKVEAAEKAAHGGGGDGAHEGMKDHEVMKEAAKDLHLELAAEVKAGKIDNAKLEPKYVAIDKLITAGHDKEADALNALYAALDATQRKAVVATVRAKQAQREAKMEARNHDEAGAPDGGKGMMGMMAKRSLERLTRGLDLDADQQKKVDAIAAKEDGAAKPGQGGRPDMAEMKKKMDALLTAFEKDGFDAKKVDPFDAKKARAPMEAEAKLIAQVVPILKPEQREKLATKLEKPPSGHGRRGASGGRPPPILEQEEDSED